MKKPNPKRLAYYAAVIGGVALLVDGTSFALNSSDRTDDTQSRPALNLKVDPTPIDRNQKLANSFASIVQKVAPSVVNVSVTARTPQRKFSGGDMELFRRFFGNNGFGPMIPDNQGPQLQRGMGAGVIVSVDGYVLTNNHVVANTKDVQVTLNDGRQLAAKVIGTDPRTDVALIKISANDLPTISLADSDKVEVGDRVLAIGNPFGIGQTVTQGIVSAKNRATSVEGDEDFIQTDAAINPGNSGGALVDTEGRLVGINSAIFTRSGGSQGIGFAVPANLCRWVMDGLVKNGRIDRGFLGVTIQNLTPDLAKAFKLDRNNGALVGDVTQGGPAESAGLKSGDVILQLNGKLVENANQLKLRVAETTPGTKVPVQVNRSGENKTFDINVGSLPGDKIAKGDSDNDGSSKETLAGVGVADLDENTRAQLNIPATLQGAVVTEVNPDSTAYEAGLRSGDVIMEINRKPIKSAQDAVNQTRNGDQTLVKVWSKGGTHYVTVDESAVD
jgi:serine protease Do